MPGKISIKDINNDDIDSLAAGLEKVINFYSKVDIASFNACLYFAQKEDECFNITARIVARFTVSPIVGSDFNHLQVFHDEAWVMYVPEQFARELSPFFSHK